MKSEEQNKNTDITLGSNEIEELENDIIEPEEVVEILDKSDITIKND